jgi:hypothetical protein
VTMSVIILWMGINSPFFTRRIDASSQSVLQQMNRSAEHEAAIPAGVPQPQPAAPAPQYSVRRVVSQ